MCIQRHTPLKRFTLVLPALVFLAIAALLISRRWTAQETKLPSFAPARAPRFDPLEPPLGVAVLRGRVVDSRGAPVADVGVFVDAKHVPHWTFTDADGRFELDELPSDETLEAVVLAWGRTPSKHALPPSGEEHTLTLPDPLPPEPRLPDIQRASIRGRVVSAFGESALDPPGYEVELLPLDTPDVLGGAIPRRASTDASGGFVLEDVALGSYRWRVLPSWARGGSWPDLLAASSSTFVHAGESSDVVLALADGALEGAVRDGKDHEIEGALILLVDLAQPTRLWPPAVSDVAGKFRMSALPAGAYQLALQAGEGRAEIQVEIVAGRVAQPVLPALLTRVEPGSSARSQ